MALTAAHNRLTATLGGTVRRDEPLARHTTYRIGGPCDLFVVADTLRDLASTISVLAEEGIEWTLLGKGSNVLAADSGYRGAVIVLGRDFRRHDVDEGKMTAGAGVVLGHIVQEAYSKGLSGLEFAVGVPGTLGGALAMNAGSRDEWIGSIVESVTIYVPGAGLVRLRASDIQWGYRSSSIPSAGVAVECVLSLVPGDTTRIRNTMDGSLSRRKTSQPLGMPSAGSVFVNPPNDSAGRLIEASGLKGHQLGGAAVSDVHANFIVNTGGACAADVLGLMHLIRDRVRDTFGVDLRPEVRFLGSFNES
ncbi:MAG: UDP-N-acetylmuramate dehydrogenase [Coriobacteriia bacterium]|nr:UDP-N-acetylmuramate dehydrogenase [Coriobacteriia bacterium]